jgi:hypothetical protein
LALAVVVALPVAALGHEAQVGLIPYSLQLHQLVAVAAVLAAHKQAVLIMALVVVLVAA